MSKKWYSFLCTEVPTRISIHAVDERAARNCLKILLKFYNEEEWALKEVRECLD